MSNSKEKKLNKLKELAESAPERDFVEIGCYSGTTAKILNSVKGDRRLFLIDSFEGMPEPNENDIPINPNANSLLKGKNYQDETEFRDMFKVKDNVVILKRWIMDNQECFEGLPNEIALLHIDTDFEDSYRAILKHLYQRVVLGGVIVFDDYGFFKGAKLAVDDFIKSTGETLHQTGKTTQAYIIKGKNEKISDTL